MTVTHWPLNCTVARNRGNMFFHRQKKTKSYHHETEIPCIRVSICTGEETAGFRNKDTGQFKEAMLIRNEEDLEAFREEYGIHEEIKKFY